MCDEMKSATSQPSEKASIDAKASEIAAKMPDGSTAANVYEAFERGKEFAMKSSQPSAWGAARDAAADICDQFAEASNPQAAMALRAASQRIRALRQQAPQEPAVCGCCNGSGWMVRDPDIGTDQECFACDGTGKAEQEQQAPAVQEKTERDREADRARFTDPQFNKWLDEGISDAGHTVWDQIGDTAAAWSGWENRPFYAICDRQRWQELDFGYNDKDGIRTFHVEAYDAGLAAASHPAPAQTGEAK